VGDGPPVGGAVPDVLSSARAGPGVSCGHLGDLASKRRGTAQRAWLDAVLPVLGGRIGISGRPAPRGEVGVLRALDWRVDLKGTRELRLTIESGEHQWTALYPGSADARAQLDALGGDVTLDRLYQIVARHMGETMTRVGDLELPPTAGRVPPS
jgi:hypothetical protein